LCGMNCLLQFCFLLLIPTVFSSDPPFVIYGSCKFSGPRPSWYQNVNLKFQTAQQITPSTTLDCGAQGYNLAHVLGWAHIGNAFRPGSASKYFENIWNNRHEPIATKNAIKRKIARFVNKLFKIDTDARAPRKTITGSLLAVKHRAVLRRPLTISVSGPTLEKLNTAWKKEANTLLDQIWTQAAASGNKGHFYSHSCFNMKKFLQILNSTPANLRYGCSSDNQGIKEDTDPMGNSGKKATPKENGWMNSPWFFACKSATPGQRSVKDQENNACRSSSSKA